MRSLALFFSTAILLAAACGDDTGATGAADASATPPDAPIVPPDATVEPPVDGPIATHDAMPDPSPDAGDLPAVGYRFVLDALLFPTTSQEAYVYGIDLDDSPDGRPDNALGTILSTLASQSPDFALQDTVTRLVDRGELIHLIGVGADDLDADGTASVVFHGGVNPSIAPCDGPADTDCRKHLQGTASFDLTPATADNPLLPASIAGGTLTGGPGEIVLALQLSPGLPAFDVELVGTRTVIEQVAADGLMTGRIGGGLTETTVDSTVIPAVTDTLNAVVASECTGTAPDCCPPGSAGSTILDLFDVDASCDLDVSEIRDNSLITSLLAPDMDLLDCSSPPCVYAPNQDGVDDTLSIGLGFSAVPADF